eukprot:1821027-Amphidinium_carterae.5
MTVELSVNYSSDSQTRCMIVNSKERALLLQQHEQVQEVAPDFALWLGGVTLLRRRPHQGAVSVGVCRWWWLLEWIAGGAAVMVDYLERISGLSPTALQAPKARRSKDKPLHGPM